MHFFKEYSFTMPQIAIFSLCLNCLAGGGLAAGINQELELQHSSPERKINSEDKWAHKLAISLENRFWKEVKGGNNPKIASHIADCFQSVRNLGPELAIVDRSGYTEQLKSLKKARFYIKVYEAKLTQNKRLLTVSYRIYIKDAKDYGELDMRSLHLDVWKSNRYDKWKLCSSAIFN